jgi:outer membrane protein assembly factor BamD (BamD/ComL family)
LPPWYKGLLQVQSPDPGTPTSGLQAQTRFLKGCNDLIDGDYAAASDSFSQVAADALSLPGSLQRVLPCMMMLAWLGLGDSIEGEAWGYKALEKCSPDGPGDARIAGLKEEMQNVDAAVSRLLARVRDRTIDASSALAVLQDAIILCNAATVLDAFASRPGAAESGVQQMYVRAKKRQVARMLDAEYHYAIRRLAENETKERMSSLDSLLFAAQVLGDEPFDRIKANLSALPDVGGAKDRMYRLAVFAQKAGRFDLARRALDAAADDLSSADTDVLEGIAGMYLAASNHKKAIDAYERLVAIAEDRGKARSVQLAIIDIYAEDLKNYDKAIQECQEYIQAYPSSAQTSRVEFRMGKLSYLGRDYAGAVGQLDGFRRRYPEHPQVGQAMLLAGLSRMAEGNTQEAIGRFSEIIRRSPDGELAARSKFLIGYAQVSSQKYRAALETFEQLIEQFPESQYVSQAQSLIDRLSRVSR